MKQWKVLKLRPGVFLSHLGVLLMFLGGGVQGIFSVRGTLALETGQTKGEFAGNDGTSVPMPFEVSLKNFQVRYWDQEKHFIHAYKKCGEPGHDGDDLLESVEVEPGKDAPFKAAGAGLTVLKFYPNFHLGESGPVTMDESRQNPALAVKLPGSKAVKPGYLFANYPEAHELRDAAGIRYVYEYNPGMIKQFESRLAFLEGGVEKFEKLINVNSPAKYKGYRLYQSGYDPKNPRFSSIQISRDPSVLFIYAGFAALMIGLTWAFWKEMK